MRRTKKTQRIGIWYNLLKYFWNKSKHLKCIHFNINHWDATKILHGFILNDLNDLKSAKMLTLGSLGSDWERVINKFTNPDLLLNVDIPSDNPRNSLNNMANKWNNKIVSIKINKIIETSHRIKLNMYPNLEYFRIVDSDNIMYNSMYNINLKHIELKSSKKTCIVLKHIYNNLPNIIDIKCKLYYATYDSVHDGIDWSFLKDNNGFNKLKNIHLDIPTHKSVLLFVNQLCQTSKIINELNSIIINNNTKADRDYNEYSVEYIKDIDSICNLIKKKPLKLIKFHYIRTYNESRVSFWSNHDDDYKYWELTEILYNKLINIFKNDEWYKKYSQLNDINIKLHGIHVQSYIRNSHFYQKKSLMLTQYLSQKMLDFKKYSNIKVIFV